MISGTFGNIIFEKTGKAHKSHKESLVSVQLVNAAAETVGISIAGDSVTWHLSSLIKIAHIVCLMRFSADQG